MLPAVATATITITGDDVAVVLPQTAPQVEEGEEEPAETQLNPIAPELKEVLWGFGSFVVLALAMRYFLYPRLRKGMDARVPADQGGHDEADRVTEEAKADVAKYEHAAPRRGASQAQKRIEAARANLDAERTERLTEVTARSPNDEQRRRPRSKLHEPPRKPRSSTPVRAVATRAGELALGRPPDSRVVSEVVAEVMSAGVSR